MTEHVVTGATTNFIIAICSGVTLRINRNSSMCNCHQHEVGIISTEWGRFAGSATREVEDLHALLAKWEGKSR